MLSTSNILEIENSLKIFFDKVDREVNSESREGKTYLKKYSERDGMNILNKVYDYSLKVCDKVNQDVIDGYDNFNLIGVQVTSTKTKTPKYNIKTVDKFPPNEYPQLNKLKFFVLTFDSRWRVYENWTELNKYFFNCKADIITLFTLKNDIINITDITKILDIIKTLYLIFSKEFEDLMNYLSPILLKSNNIQNINSTTADFKTYTF
ncbi:SMEK domain-containing protein [Candidatus Gracilibacteria bacterium]|nr:SMEK domain-containing protein [Candidatus Gracilibacteria bacterium]NUJ98533.1 SMEK domain-containing protein [Candidatus Gracilibacteria bacterium]